MTILLDLIVAGCLLLIFFGIGLLGNPTTVSQATGVFARYVKTVLQLLLTPIRVERFIYRHHRLFGLTILLITTAVLLFLKWPTAQVRGIEQSFFALEPQRYGMMRAGYLLLQLVSLGAFMIGLFIFSRPSALKSFEQWANQPVGMGLFKHYWQRCCATTSCWMAGHYRLAGLTMVAFGSALFYLLLPYW